MKDQRANGGAEEMVELPVKVRRNWQEPTPLERETHSRTHVPYRAWCEFCVKGKADSAPHRRRQSASLNGNPAVSMGYMFMKAPEAETPAEGEKEESANLRGNSRLITKLSLIHI